MSYRVAIPNGNSSDVIVDVTRYDVTVLGTKNVIISEGASGQGGRIWATFNQNRIIATGGTGGAPARRNDILNVPELIRGAIYEVTGATNASGRANYVTYNIDNEGRVARIRANLTILDPPGTPRLQRTSGTRDNILSGLACKVNGVRDGLGCTNNRRANPTLDNGGHMIRAQFDGPVELINYHSQNVMQNQEEDWFKMEEEWDKVLNGTAVTATQPNGVVIIIVPATPNGQTVEVDIQPQFIPNSTNRRPTSFIVDYWYGGTKQDNTNNPNYRPTITN